MDRITIAQATDSQLRDYAEKVLGLAFEPTATRDEFAAEIVKADPSGEISIETPDAPSPHTPAGPAPWDIGQGLAILNMKPLRGKGPSYQTDPIVTLIINKTEEHGGAEPIPLCVNGKRLDVPRGVPVDLPWRYFLNLAQCIKTIHTQVGPNNIQARDVQAYPFNIIHLPPRDEISAWHVKDAKNLIAA